MVTTSRRGRRQEPDSAPRLAPAASASDARSGLFREEPGRLLLRVRVSPRCGRDAMILDDGLLRIKLAAAPVDGAANDALVALLSSRLRVPRRSVTLVRGATSRAKLIAIQGLSAADFWARLGC